MSTAPIRFKVGLTHRNDPQPAFHRFTGTYNFSELSSVVSHLWGERPKHSVLNYIDDEGDAIRIATEAEWEECVRIHQRSGAALLRLSGVIVKKPSRKTHASASSSSDDESEPEMEKTDTAPSTTIGVPEVEIPEESTPTPTSQPASQPTSVRGRNATPELPVVESVPEAAKAAVLLEAEAPPEPKHTSATPEPDVNTGATAVDLMSLVYNCDAGEELFKGHLGKFPGVAKRVVDPANPDEVHLDIDRSVLFRDTLFKSSELMANKCSLPKAQTLVKTAMVVFEDNVHLQYKLACILSLQGDLEDALDMLLVVVSNGFEDTCKLETDPDLAKVRKHPRFVEVVPSSEPEHEYYTEEEVIPAPAPASPEPPVASNKAGPRQPISAEDPNVLSLISMFPDMSVEEAVCVLVLAKNDLTRAINARLAGHYVR